MLHPFVKKMKELKLNYNSIFFISWNLRNQKEPPLQKIPPKKIKYNIQNFIFFSRILCFHCNRMDDGKMI